MFPEEAGVETGFLGELGLRNNLIHAAGEVFTSRRTGYGAVDTKFHGHSFRTAGGAGLGSHKRFDTLCVIPAKAGIQQRLLWIPAFAGKTPVVGMPHDFAGVKLFTRLTTGFVAGSGSTNATPSPESAPQFHSRMLPNEHRKARSRPNAYRSDPRRMESRGQDKPFGEGNPGIADGLGTSL